MGLLLDGEQDMSEYDHGPTNYSEEDDFGHPSFPNPVDLYELALHMLDDD